MDKHEMERQRRRRIARIKKRKRRARIRGLVLLVAIFVVFGGVFHKLKSMASRGDSGGGNQVEWFVLKNMGALNPARAYTPEEVGNLTNNIINDRIDIHLAKGENHITRASSYAYDAGEISEIIEGKREYKGNKKIAFLTFDDGPNQKISPQVLDILKEKDAHGTFFVVGKSVREKNRDVLLRELNEGHAIALHSFSHDYHTLYPGRVANAAAIEDEAVKTQKALQDILGKNFHSGAWRYPGGHMSWKGLDTADQKLKDLGISWIDWNALTGDAEPASRRPTTPEGLVEFLKKSMPKNDDASVVVILMHDAETKQLSADALPHVIDALRADGYSFGILK